MRQREQADVGDRYGNLTTFCRKLLKKTIKKSSRGERKPRVDQQGWQRNTSKQKEGGMS